MAYYFSLAWRNLRASLWLVAILIATLAVGVAASVTANVLRYALSRTPMPDKANLLLNVQNPDAGRHMGNLLNYTSAYKLSQLGKQYGVSTYSGVGFGVAMARSDMPTKHFKAYIRYTTRNFFDMFNVKLAKGRLWTMREGQSQAPVVVISKDVVRELFPEGDALGKTLTMGDVVYRIIGVTEPWNIKPRFYNLEHPAGPFGGSSTSVFMPVHDINMAPDDMMYQIGCPGVLHGFPDPAAIIPEACHWFRVWYLANSDADADALRRLVQSRLPDIFPARLARKMQVLNVNQVLERADLVPGSVRLYALLGMVFLLLCTVNASGMQLSRVLRRRGKIGIRRALGASRSDIVKQYMAEAVLIGGIAGALGIALTFAGLYGVRHALHTYYANMAQLDASMFGAMVLLIVVCSLLMGMVPAWLASLQEPSRVIKSTQ